MGGVVALFSLSVLLAGCQSTAKKAPAAAGETNAPPARAEGMEFSGRIIRVNAEQRYVVVECALLPRADEEARVLRGEQTVGRVKFTGPVSFPYAAADVLDGLPMVGDRVRK